MSDAEGQTHSDGPASWAGPGHAVPNRPVLNRPGPNRPRRRPGQQAPILDPERRRRLGASFAESSGAAEAREYDAVRPRYPEPIVRRILESCGEAVRGGPSAPWSPDRQHAARPGTGERLRIVELGAGTGILTRALLAEGADVEAVEPSIPMTEVMAERWQAEAEPAPSSAAESSTAEWGQLTIHRTTAEQTGLPENSADLVVAAQAWHWFDDDAVTAEVQRVLRRGGVLAVVGNFLDTSYEWVHRLTRITRAGDIYIPDWTPPADATVFQPWTTAEHRWERMIAPEAIRRLAMTLSSWLSADGRERSRRLANLDWYLDEHLQLPAGQPVTLPYITQLHLARLR